MPALTNSTDEALAKAAKEGSLRCFDELVRRYQVPLLRFLQRRGPYRQDAEDVIQDAFLRAYQSIEKYRDGEPFKPWLFTIAYRLAIDSSRRKRPVGSWVDDLPDSAGDGPLDVVEENDSKDRLWQLVRRTLTDEPFSAVWLYYAESMPTEEVARTIGRSRDWVKTALLRARAKIKLAMTMEEKPRDRAIQMQTAGRR